MTSVREGFLKKTYDWYVAAIGGAIHLRQTEHATCLIETSESQLPSQNEHTKILLQAEEERNVENKLLPTSQKTTSIRPQSGMGRRAPSEKS